MRRPISYYDNVKDDVDDSNDSSKPNFDTLREAAQENTEPEDEREGDNTQIEILEEGLQRRKRGQTTSGSSQNSMNSSGSTVTESSMGESSANPMTSASSGSESSDPQNPAIEEKLDKLIEQNERIIEVLESFGS